jgi:ribonuclease M5
LIHVKEAVIVEGKYDKIKLSSIIDGLILETDGFRIFKDREKMALLRKLAAARGLLVLTDSDSAGFLIRHYLSGSIPPAQIKHAYIPDIFGKEKRKSKPSREGKLGVEGVPDAAIVEALQRAGVAAGEGPQADGCPKITKTDLYLSGLSGKPGSAQKRRKFLHRLNLPEHLSANALPEVLSALMSKEEFYRISLEILTPEDDCAGD